MITVTINGKKLEAQEGEMILTVARSAGIEIPALCAEDRLAPYNSCGTCVVDVEGMGIVKSCSTPVRDGMVVTTNSPEAEDTRRTAIELLLSNHWGDCVAPCQQACPAHTDCQGYVGLTANKMFEESLQLLYEALPFPAVFGRICPAPCEDACRRQIADEPVQIRHIKRFVGDYGIDYLPSILPDTGKVIAVVGGGPAGLSAAYFLRRRGHTVHVFDAMPKMGGMLRYGIPDYRLPQDVLDREIDVLRRMNIVFYNGKRLGKDIDYDELKSQYDAVFLGLGAWGSRSMGLPGEEHPAVMQGSEFLRKVNEGERPILPKKVAVIGGGNTAMDAARSAIRLGAEVTVLYRRGQEQMPALEHEVEEAEEEGIVFSYLTQPVEFISDGATLSAVKCVRMELGEPDDSGRRRPVPVEGSEFEVEAGMALLAVGQMVDTSSLAESGI
ncbi:MAG TPA: 2Fe-2S iron-sulfur cluster binding domain-containing protein, partial [Candidatus Acetothermia bacterium]|nr:2Fe-2S iron-sulfur cluster binding domain-containing protein [Candidatus Acetothermia bacterium]HEX32296.1 2Fe-2S iron-sulfur cluster binding domain-containing protein [Candidatus Acetothermia bacterium]